VAPLTYDALAPDAAGGEHDTHEMADPDQLPFELQVRTTLPPVLE
jgi:hypothetical protein